MVKSKKEQLQAEHEAKLIELYNTYYEKAKEDSNTFKAFNDVAKELFKDNSEENELMKILNNAKVGE